VGDLWSRAPGCWGLGSTGEGDFSSRRDSNARLLRPTGPRPRALLATMTLAIYLDGSLYMADISGFMAILEITCLDLPLDSLYNWPSPYKWPSIVIC